MTEIKGISEFGSSLCEVRIGEGSSYRKSVIALILYCVCSVQCISIPAVDNSDFHNQYIVSLAFYHLGSLFFNQTEKDSAVVW